MDRLVQRTYSKPVLFKNPPSIQSTTRDELLYWIDYIDGLINVVFYFFLIINHCTCRCNEKSFNLWIYICVLVYI